ncbi:MAG: dGTP triphosphohydrolase [Akkermansiaceae bacterium]
MAKNTFYNRFDTERLSDEKYDETYRSTFQVDRDRVLHTPTFRSLQSKTQVFWSGEYDFYRTRLTHSLEVAQIGRSICNFLNTRSELLSDDYFIDSDLVEAACLSHDLGHPPFGHAGERTLNRLMSEYGGFEGNAQTLRLLADRIFTASKTGMNPSRAFVDSILKYKTLWSELCHGAERPKNHFLYDQQFHYLDWVCGDRDFPTEYTPGKARDKFSSIECQIMDWADDTAYSLNDLADSVRAGFLTIERVERWADENDCGVEKGTPVGDLLRSIRGNRVELMAGNRIGRYIQSVRIVEDNNFMSEVSNRYKYKLVVDQGVQSETREFKKMAYDLVFRSPELNQLEHKGDHLLSKLWEILGNEDSPYHLLPKEVSDELRQGETLEERRRLLCDFLASLTDGSATRLYKRLMVPDFGSIGDLLG